MCIERLNGLQVVYYPAARALDDQVAIVCLGQFLVTAAATYLFH